MMVLEAEKIIDFDIDWIPENYRIKSQSMSVNNKNEKERHLIKRLVKKSKVTRVLSSNEKFQKVKLFVDKISRAFTNLRNDEFKKNLRILESISDLFYQNCIETCQTLDDKL